MNRCDESAVFESAWALCRNEGTQWLQFIWWRVPTACVAALFEEWKRCVSRPRVQEEMQVRHKGVATDELVRRCWTIEPTGDGSQYTLGDIDDIAWYFERMPGDTQGHEDLRMFGGHESIFRFESKAEDRDRLLFLLRYVHRLFDASGAEGVYLTHSYQAGPHGAHSQIRVR